MILMKYFALTIVSLCAAGAFAQSRSSFQNVGTIDAIGVDSSNGGLTYTVNVGAAPSFSLGGFNYSIQDVFGFWLLSNQDISATHSDTGVWDAHENNAGSGGIAGWKTNPNTGLVVNQSKAFTFDALNVSSPTYGFHVRLTNAGNGPLAGNTLYVTGTPVPEPATMSVLALSLAAMVAKRKKK